MVRAASCRQQGSCGHRRAHGFPGCAEHVPFRWHDAVDAARVHARWVLGWSPGHVPGTMSEHGAFVAPERLQASDFPPREGGDALDLLALLGTTASSECLTHRRSSCLGASLVLACPCASSRCRLPLLQDLPSEAWHGRGGPGQLGDRTRFGIAKQSQRWQCAPTAFVLQAKRFFYLTENQEVVATSGEKGSVEHKPLLVQCSPKEACQGMNRRLLARIGEGSGLHEGGCRGERVVQDTRIRRCSGQQWFGRVSVY